MRRKQGLQQYRLPTRPAAGPAANGAEKPGNLRSDITAALRAYPGEQVGLTHKS